eukprot:TRINITY_DN29627_c0_g1_i1.p1 TRINITY_DN29627_c0_g1~~TRINITY_DN29627_c0_g1_i1.p1  ORF type:complete len:1310 (+),score=216.09 TRINITY_DN29627_c0_g1_i1:506-3931(+)
MTPSLSQQQVEPQTQNGPPPAAETSQPPALPTLLPCGPDLATRKGQRRHTSPLRARVASSASSASPSGSSPSPPRICIVPPSAKAAACARSSSQDARATACAARAPAAGTQRSLAACANVAGASGYPEPPVGLLKLPAHASGASSSGSADHSPATSARSSASPSDGCHPDQGTVEWTFRSFSGQRSDMDGKTFVKLCKDCGLLDKAVTAKDADIIFARAVPKGQRRLSFSLGHFDAALALVAQRKGVEYEAVVAMVAASDGPVHHCTKAEAIRFHDDKSTYTGTHRSGGPDTGCKGAGTMPSVVWPAVWPRQLGAREASSPAPQAVAEASPGLTSASPTTTAAAATASMPSGGRSNTSAGISPAAAMVLSTEDGDEVSALPAVEKTPAVRAAKTTGARSEPVLPLARPRRAMSPTTAVVVQPVARPTLDGGDLKSRSKGLRSVEETFRTYCSSGASGTSGPAGAGNAVAGVIGGGGGGAGGTGGTAAAAATNAVQGQSLDGKSFAKLCRDCRLVDGCDLTATDVDLIFAKVVPRQQRRIDFRSFELALQLVAERRGCDLAEVHQLVARCDGKVLLGTRTENVRFHDDKNTYTGTHVHGGPDTGGVLTPESLLRSSLRHDSAHRLPDMVRRHLSERPAPLAAPAPVPAAQVPLRTHPRNSMKSKPPGDSEETTLVFTDVQGSTSQWEANPEAMEQALRLHDATIRRVAAKRCGYEVTTEGDAFQVAFHDALDAVGFCLDVQTELLECAWPPGSLEHRDAAPAGEGAWRGLRVRMGLHTGRPATITKHEVTGRVRYAGPSVALAKAVEGVSCGGQIVLTATSFAKVDGLLTRLGSPQVIDLGEHVLLEPDCGDAGAADATSVEGAPSEGSAGVVRLFQLVPEALAHDYSPCTGVGGACSSLAAGCGGVCAGCGRGRVFGPVDSLRCVSPGFDLSPAGPCVALCFAFTPGARELATSSPALAATALGLLRRCVRAVIASAGRATGYECQEDEGAFMLAFADLTDAAAFGAALQQRLPTLPWPEELLQLSPGFSRGLRMAVGALSGRYTCRRPHTSTGRADYFGTIVNRAARIAAAAHPGQVLLSGDVGALGDSSSGDGWVLERLGAFALKGIEHPLPLQELRVRREDGALEAFAEIRTKGRVSD